MRRGLDTVVVLLTLLTLGCGGEGMFEDVTSDNVPRDRDVHSMDAEFGDFDSDGDLDIAIAVEGGPNRLYLNDGMGAFTWREGVFVAEDRDTEDLAVADFNEDGNLDIVFAAENEGRDELYFGDGQGGFIEVTARLGGLHKVSNAVEVADVDSDGHMDILFGNGSGMDQNGRNYLFMGDGQGSFEEVSETRLPDISDETQDVKFGDMDGDGDLDIVVGNEEPPNRLWLNDGTGAFTDATDRLELVTPLMTREVLIFDADADGDLDLVFLNLTSNAQDYEKDPQNRILINDGSANFSDETATRLPENDYSSWDGGYMDVDHDGDLDLIVSAIRVPGFDRRPWQAWINDGTGHFTEQSSMVFGKRLRAYGWDVEVADLNGDGIDDMFLPGRASQNLLLLGKPVPATPPPGG